MTNKTADDFKEAARELLCAIINKNHTTCLVNKIEIDLIDSVPLISYYLLDAFNDGYDAAITSRRINND